MKLDTERPMGRRWVRVAIWVGIFAGTFAVLKVNAFFEGSSLISLIIVLAALLLGAYFTSKLPLRIVFLVLANVVFLFVVFIRPLTREVTVSTSAVSPDGRVVAEIYEPSGFIDRNFVVRLKTEGRWGIPRYNEYFRSPDEGFPPAERLLWSKDGRYVLLLGKRTSLPTVQQEACLPSGECLYLLVDTRETVIYANTTGGRNYRATRSPNPFSVDELSGIDFGESIASVSC